MSYSKVTLVIDGIPEGDDLVLASVVLNFMALRPTTMLVDVEVEDGQPFED